MAFFKRNRDKQAQDAPKAASTEDAWKELEALVKAQDAKEAEDKAKTDEVGALGGRDFVGKDLQDYSAPNLTADLGDAPSIDATPGRVDVDLDALLGEAEASMADLDAQSASVAAASSSASAAAANVPSRARTEAPKFDDDFEFNVPPSTGRDGRADIGAMRLDVARISADIQSGEELYRRAQKRIENLTSFVERAEIDFSLINRLEPENRRLKARNRTLETEIDEARRKVAVMEADLEDHRRRLADRAAVLEQLQSKMTMAQRSLQEYERVLASTRETSDRHALAAERAQTSLDVERRENEVLRAKLVDVTSSIDEKHTAVIEAQKMTDSLRQDAVDFRAAAERLGNENIELRNAFDAAQKQNNQMKGEMVSLHEDIRTFKTQYEFNVIAREDEVTAMKAQIDEMRKQLEIKDEIVRNAARDVQELRKIRTAQDLERERLEGIIETQGFQLDEANNKLLATQQEVTDFDRRYRDVATALAQTEAQRQVVTPAAHPDIAPMQFEPQAPMQPGALTGLSDGPLGEMSDLNDDEINDQITDFALGLRSDLTG